MRTMLVIVTLLFAATANANPPRYSRKPDLKLDVKLSARVRPTQPTAAPHARPTADEVLHGHERAEPLRRQQEVILEGLVADAPDSDPDKPDYMFRLAEHYAKQMRFWRLKSIEATLPPPTR